MNPAPPPKRLPPWLRGARLVDPAVHPTRSALRRHGVHTVCEEARCPNRGECFGRRTATFMILGDSCTRRCGFCAVEKGRPVPPPDPGEPGAVAEAARDLGLRFVVVTSVTRDDLPDGGAAQFAAVIRAVRERCPGTRVEVLVPDFAGNTGAADRVLAERPDVFNHNVETVPRLYPSVRPGADYRRSLDLLRRAAAAPGVRFVKSGLMVGLGETREETLDTMRDIREAGGRILTLGQYLRPTRWNLPVERYVTPDEFAGFEAEGLGMGFEAVFSGPLVRSSYLAHEIFEKNTL